MNKYQRQYATAKAHFDTLEAAEAQIELDYIIDNDITNADGTVPSRIFMIDSEEVFDAACIACDPAISALSAYEARTALHAAEDALIEYGLSIVPLSVKTALHDKAIGKNADYTTRKKIIDVTFRLDTRTAPKPINI